MRSQEEKFRTLLLATHNQAKLEELKIGIKPLIKKGVKIVTLSDLNIKQNPKETGKNFEENAKLKAKFYGDLTGYPTIADDGGLIIHYLNNEPGVKSKRWLGYEASDEELIAHTLKRLKGLSKQKRLAYLQTCLCFYNPSTRIYLCRQEKIKGYIAQKPSGKATDGYPFRALFIVDKYNKYYDELTEEEHLQINHRLKALRRLIDKLFDISII